MTHTEGKEYSEDIVMTHTHILYKIIEVDFMTHMEDKEVDFIMTLTEDKEDSVDAHGAKAHQKSADSQRSIVGGVGGEKTGSHLNHHKSKCCHLPAYSEIKRNKKDFRYTFFLLFFYSIRMSSGYSICTKKRDMRSMKILV